MQMMDENNREYWYKHAQLKINEEIASLTKVSDQGIAVATEVENSDESINSVEDQNPALDAENTEINDDVDPKKSY